MVSIHVFAVIVLHIPVLVACSCWIVQLNRGPNIRQSLEVILLGMWAKWLTLDRLGDLDVAEIKDKIHTSWYAWCLLSAPAAARVPVVIVQTNHQYCLAGKIGVTSASSFCTRSPAWGDINSASSTLPTVNRQTAVWLWGSLINVDVQNQ